MAVHRCPQCSFPYTDDEIEQGVCPACQAPLAAPAEPAGPPARDVPAPVATTSPHPRRAVPFLLGLFLGCLVGAGGLGAALALGAPLPGGLIEGTAAFRAVQDHKADADKRASEAEVGRQEAEARRADVLKALDDANVQAVGLRRQKDDAERRAGDALARLTEEQGRRASLEKAVAEAQKPKMTPTLSYVRDWRLVGPFPTAFNQAHDAVFPPEREPIRLDKAYDGYGGKVKWQPYHGNEDKIDLAEFFHYKDPGDAYAVSWVHSDQAQDVALGIGSDDGVVVWVNREKVHEVRGGRVAQPDQDVVKIHLRTGWNEIMAKVDNITDSWALYLEFRTADNSQPLKVFSTNSPPPAAPR